MNSFGQRYVQYINCTYKRSGMLFLGWRFGFSIIQQHEYFFVCQCYIEMNSVRAGIVKHPREYRWSSYQSNGQGKNSDLLNPHSLYFGLAQTDAERQTAYRDLFRYELESGEIDKIRKATNGNYAHGNTRFKEEISKMLGRRVTPEKQEDQERKKFRLIIPHFQNNTGFCSLPSKGYEKLTILKVSIWTGKRRVEF